MIELLVVGYLAIGLISGVLLWLVQRNDPLANTTLEDDSTPPLAVVLFLAGLAWPLSLPLVTWGWLRDQVHRRALRRRS